MPRRSRATLCIDDYDCIGFDLDHTLCRYHVDNLFKLVYKLLSEYLVEKKGYDPDICKNPLENDIHLIAKGLTLDCERGNILRISSDGYILGKVDGDLFSKLEYYQSCSFAKLQRTVRARCPIKISNVCMVGTDEDIPSQTTSTI